MAAIRDRYDNILDENVYKQWCKRLGIKPLSPSSHNRWKKGVSEGTIFLVGTVLFDNSDPHNAFQLIIGV